MELAYLNGTFLPRAEARISPDDRGFNFGDGLYEVTPFYRGRPFRLDAHLARLTRGLRELEIGGEGSAYAALHGELIERNGLGGHEMAIVYLQVTRGTAPRAHPYPDPPVPPTVWAWARPFQRPSSEEWARGYAAISVPDRRWARADLKTIQLLPNAMAQQAAKAAGATDALFVRDGLALEGGQTNVFAVLDGILVTHPASNQILHGISRAVVLEVARELGIPVEERPMTRSSLAQASELMFTGTTTEVRPTVRLDGEPVGGGEVGPVARALHEGFMRVVARECGP